MGLTAVTETRWGGAEKEGKVAMDSWPVFMVVLVALLLLARWGVKARLSRRERSRQESLFLSGGGAVHEERAPDGSWPVHAYEVWWVGADRRVRDVQEWELSWPQVRLWAEEFSTRSTVGEVWVSHEDPAARVTTAWTWEDGVQTSKTGHPWSWQSKVVANRNGR